MARSATLLLFVSTLHGDGDGNGDGDGDGNGDGDGDGDYMHFIVIVGYRLMRMVRRKLFAI